MKRPELFLMVFLLSLAVGGGLAMQTLRDRFNGDWAAVRDCRETYWQCDVEWAAVSRIPQTAAVTFAGEAKGCDGYRAYQKASERARFDCAMSRRAQGSTCAELEHACVLPQTHY